MAPVQILVAAPEQSTAGQLPDGSLDRTRSDMLVEVQSSDIQIVVALPHLKGAHPADFIT